MIFRVQNLHVVVDDKPVIKGVSLTIRSGQIHAIMGPNGSGKSTLAYSLMAHPSYKVKNKIFLNDKDISRLKTPERAKRGIFLALQSPIAIPGVTVTNLLRTAYQELHGEKSFGKKIRGWKANSMTLAAFTSKLKADATMLNLDESFLRRGIHDGFSGGEKKKMEMLQALMLEPKFAIFDEIDTGLDVDALQVVARGIELLAKRGTGVLIITHYQRILKYLKPDYVHILVAGKIVDQGSASLADAIETEGYRAYR